MTFHRLCLTSITFLVFQPCAHAVSSGEIPFRLYRGHWIMVEGALFDRNDKLQIVLDTGAGGSFVNSRTAKRLELPLLDKFSTVRAFGTIRRVRRTILRGLRLGSRMETIAGYVVDLPWNEMDAILGLDVLRRIGLAIDYENKTVRFGARDPLKSQVPFEMVNSSVVVRARISDQDVRLAVDTGVGQTTLSRDSVKAWVRRLRGGRRLALVHAAGSSRGTEVRLPMLQVGPDRWTDVPVLVLDAGKNGRSEDGVLSPMGMGIKRIQFDFENRLLSWDCGHC